MAKNLRGSDLVRAKVDAMCEMILDGVMVSAAAERIKQQFGTGMTWNLWYALADGSYAHTHGHAVESYKAKWAAKIAAMPDNERPRKTTMPVLLPTPVGLSGRSQRIIEFAAAQIGLDARTIDELLVTPDGYSVKSSNRN